MLFKSTKNDEEKFADGDSATCGELLCSRDEEKRVLRKIDMVILPMLCFVFFFQYLDKQSLSYAAVFGLISDLDLRGSQYSWCTSIFYIGQLAAEYPFIYLMSRLPLTKFVGGTIMIWGAICMCLAAPTSFGGFAAVRFLLGFAEGAVSPAFVTITSIWYQKKDHPMRIGLWISMNGLAQVLGCFLMYGIGKNQSLSLAPWRVMFLVCGALTTTAGIVFYVLMPQGPRDAWFLTEREKEVLMHRMRADNEGGDFVAFSWRQFREALLGDVKTWFVFAFGVLVTMQSPVLFFTSLVIKNIGYDKFETILYQSPSGAIQIVFIWIAILGCYILPRHGFDYSAVDWESASFEATSLCEAGTHSCVVASIISNVMTILLSLSASNVKGNTKRAVVNSPFFIGYCVGCIASPQLWTHAPRYFEGVVTAIVTWCLLFVTVGAYWLICARENTRRDRENSEAVEVNGVEAGKRDVTDREDRRFRYNC